MKLGFLKKISDSAKETTTNFLITLVSISVFTLCTSIFLYVKFASDYKLVALKTYHEYIDNIHQTNNREYFIFGPTTLIFDKKDNKIYEIKNKKFLPVNKNSVNNSVLRFNIETNVYLEYPFYIIYDFGDVTVKIDTLYPRHFSAFVFMVLILTTLIINFLHARSLNKNTSKLKNLKISVQEYALSQRTTSYLVSILHHKLNTPIKILATKSRVLSNVISEDNNVPADIVEKSKTDFNQLDNALKTIIGVTNKLKEYNELSQHESNVHKLFTISKETIDILRDDEFDIDIDYKAKLFDIDRTRMNSHEIIQIFINQIKFSLAQLSDKIGIRIFKSDSTSITILYSDNGNIIDKKLLELIEHDFNLSEISDSHLENDHYDLLLNFSILNDGIHSSIRLLSSNKNGNVFEIKLPTFKQELN